jgi:hypothetical protein
LTLKRLGRHWDWLLVVASLLLVALTYRDYGITWDEGVHSQYGELALKYFTSGFRDRSSSTYLDMHNYGPLIEMIPAIVYGSHQEWKYEARHVVFGLMALLVIPGLRRYARLWGDPLVPVFAVAAVVMMPRFYGDWYNNSKDVPFAIATVWFMYATAAFFLKREFCARQVIGCGVALGVALCVRPGGFPLLAIYFACAAALSRLAHLPIAGSARQGPSIRPILFKTAAILAIAWVIMVIPWPWAHENMVTHPIQAMKVAASFTTSYPVLYDGRVFMSSDLPWHYLIKFLLITTPPATLLLAVVGLAFGVKDQITAFRSDRSLLAGVTQMWLFVPLIVFVIKRPNVYDGLRHFLFILPAVAVLAAIGASGVLSGMRCRKARLVAWPAILVLLLLPLKDLIRLHPYQMTYFNAFVGGLGGGYGRYETDYWVSSYREAMLWVNERARREPQRRFVVLVGGTVYVEPAAAHYRAPNVVIMIVPGPLGIRELPPDADYYIATTRYFLATVNFPDTPVLHTIGRDGAVFTVIKGRCAASHRPGVAGKGGQPAPADDNT